MQVKNIESSVNDLELFFDSKGVQINADNSFSVYLDRESVPELAQVLLQYVAEHGKAHEVRKLLLEMMKMEERLTLKLTEVNE